MIEEDGQSSVLVALLAFVKKGSELKINVGLQPQS